MATATVLPHDRRKYIKLIEGRYSEVFVEGSFKYCPRVCQLLALRFPPSLELMEI
jgi:hypothetical protein